MKDPFFTNSGHPSMALHNAMAFFGVTSLGDLKAELANMTPEEARTKLRRVRGAGRKFVNSMLGSERPLQQYVTVSIPKTEGELLNLHCDGVTVIPGPVWTDECGHDKRSYVCSFSVFNRGAETKHDLYLFGEATEDVNDLHVCIRYGNDGPLYESPGRLMDFLKSAWLFGAKAPTYETAAKIIMHYFRFRIEMK